MGKGGNQVQETAAQRAQADHAKAQLADYKTRWLPVQQQLAAQIEGLKSSDNTLRREAEGRSTTDNAMQFAQAEGALQKQQSNSGVNVNSSRAKLAVSGMGNDASSGKAAGQVITDQQIDNAYTSGLQALTSLGRGERAQVNAGLGSQAAQSAQTAYSDAQMSLAQRTADAGIVGQAAGFGLQQAFKAPAPATPGTTGVVPNTAFRDGSGSVFNNPSAWAPAGG